MTDPIPSKISLPVVGAADYRHAVAGETWELSPASISGPIDYRSAPRDESPASIAKLAAASLATPMDFPAIDAAILPGDHVALAVDPNVPQVESVIEGVVDTLVGCGAGRISIVLWPEASDAIVDRLKTRFQNTEPGASHAPEHDRSDSTPIITVARHRARVRGELRYVAADADAEAIYLSRDLVDADLMLPIVVARAADAIERLDKTGVFPMFADSSTMRRYQGGIMPTVVDPESDNESNSTDSDPDADDDVSNVPPRSFDASDAAVNEVGFLLGVQVMMIVCSNAAGGVGRILAGTPDAIRHEMETLHAVADHETSPQAELVVAAIDGDASVQTWSNVARAAIAAAKHLQGDGTIVVWSRLNTNAGRAWQEELTTSQSTNETSSPDDFDDWPTDRVLARKLATLLSDHRILLHFDRGGPLGDADVESLGLGVIASVEELRNLGQSHRGGGVIRAAHYHAPSVARLAPTETDFDDENS